MKKALQRIVISLSSLGLGPFFVFIYHLIYRVSQALLFESNLQVWCRNSLKFNKISPGASDIDLTALYSGIDRKNPFELFNLKHSLLKKIFPILGEVNFYSYQDLKKIRKSANFFELKRDPELDALINIDLTHEEIKFDALVFYTQALWNDWNYLNAFESSRFKKWSYLTQSIESKLNLSLDINITSIDIIFSNLKLLTPELETETSKLKSFLNNKESEDTYFLFYICRWLGDYWDKPIFKEKIASLSNLNTSQKEFIKAQVRWEVMGIYSQIIQINDPVGLNYHYDNLLMIINELGRDEFIESDIKIIKERINSYS